MRSLQPWRACLNGCPRWNNAPVVKATKKKNLESRHPPSQCPHLAAEVQVHPSAAARLPRETEPVAVTAAKRAVIAAKGAVIAAKGAVVTVKRAVIPVMGAAFAVVKAVTPVN